MKNVYSIVLICLCICGLAQKGDTRTFEQINDSILKEAHLIYRYDKAFTSAMANIDADRVFRRNAGEILIKPKGDKLLALIFEKNSNSQLAGEMVFDAHIDTASLITIPRPATADEINLLNIKHRVMTEVQTKYEIVYGKDDTYLNPIFIPFTEIIRGKEINLYKLYLTTETNKDDIIPFGLDYLFIAKDKGNVFYNLQFNKYMPILVTDEILENQSVFLEYHKREPYITPTDIYLFIKYGTPYLLSDLRVKSKNLGVYFDYNWDRETLNAALK